MSLGKLNTIALLAVILLAAVSCKDDETETLPSLSGLYFECPLFAAPGKAVTLTPKEVDFDQSSIFVEYWHGLYCYEKSQMEGKETFPMTEEGRLAMKAWLEAQV
mgnify:CR=1 FL=1